MECPNCNKNYDDEFRFCPFCGEAQPEPKICTKCEFETYDEYLDYLEYMEKVHNKKVPEM